MFNTMAYSKELEQAGFSRDQAEATINVFFKFMEYNFATKTDIAEANDATKSSLTETSSELKIELSKVRSEMNQLGAQLRVEMSQLATEIRTEISDIRYQISALENRMIIKFGLMQAATIGILAAIIKLV